MLGVGGWGDCCLLTGIRNWMGVLKEVVWECWKGIEIVGSLLGVRSGWEFVL